MKIIYIFIFIFPVFCFAQQASEKGNESQEESSAQVLSSFTVGIDFKKQPGAKKGMTFDDWFKEQITKATQNLQQAKSVFQNLPQYIKKTSYMNSTEINATKPNVGGIIFNYGYAGHGPLDLGFSGFETKIDFTEIPNWLEKTFKDALGTLGFANLVHFTPTNEFLLKTVLLFKDYKNKSIEQNVFVGELLFLLVRLARTPSFKGFSTLLQQVSPIVKTMFTAFKIKGKSIIEYLDLIYNQVKWLVTYDFAIENKSVLDLTQQEILVANAKDIIKIYRILTAITLQAIISYMQAREEFLASEAGTDLAKKLEDAKTAQEKNQVEKEIRNVIPEYKEIKNTVAKRIYGLIQRIRGYKQLREKLLNKIRPKVDPILKEIGLSLDMFVDSEYARKLEEQELAKEMEQEAAYEDMYKDDLFDFDVEGEI